MSVAFRRESDEEHLEPKFEIPIPAGPNLVTRRGAAQIEAKVRDLRADLATLTDEAAITDAKRQLRYWDTRHATAELMPDPGLDQVAFGARVTFALGGKPRTLTIVGDDEADPGQGLISFSSPLGRALMGTEVGDLIDFNGKEDALEVIAIEVPEGT